MIIKPKDVKNNSPLSIIIHTSSIEIKPISWMEDVSVFVKKRSYRWDRGSWFREIGPLSGSVYDRYIEICCDLLIDGFIIDIPENVIEDIENQNYQEECTTWILEGRGEFKGWFRLWWKRSSIDYWNTARNFLTDNKYDHGTSCLCVPAIHYKEIEDFAEIHGFQFNSLSKIILAEAKKTSEEYLVLNLVKKQQSKRKKQSYQAIDFSDKTYREFTIGTKTKLYPHQATAVSKLIKLKIGGLFMDMGTGKTRTAIEMIINRQTTISNVVWLCPVSLKETIYQEILKHTNTKKNQITKFDDNTEISNIKQTFWNIIGIESLSSSDRVILTMNHILNEESFVIIDESSYIKGHNSKRTLRATSLAEKSKYRLILTGTPLTQGVVDLYSQMRFLSPDILGYKSFYSFARKHLEYSEKYPDMIVNTKHTNLLAEKINPFVYQVTKKECITLPDKLYDTIYYSMSDEQRSAYEQCKYDILLSKDVDSFDSYVIFQLFSALQQITSGFRIDGENIIEYKHDRINKLLNVINNIDSNEKIIIWCKYRYSVQTIYNHLDDCSVLYGDLSESKRNGEIEKFRNENRFLVATQATGGHGLTLNESKYSIFYENEFKYSNRIQAEDRNHRIGQDFNVTYIDISCTNSIDERITSSLNKKGNVVADFKRKLDTIKNKERFIKRL